MPLASTHQHQRFLCSSVTTRNVSRHGQMLSGEGELSPCKAPGVQIQPLKQNCHRVKLSWLQTLKLGIPSGTVIMKINEDIVYCGPFGKFQKVKCGLMV